jgi:2'-5' RNA ligase
MSLIRAFIAIELPIIVQQHLDQTVAELSQKMAGMPIRWLPATNIHLTLKFLGDVSKANLQILKEMLQTEAVSQKSFEFSIGGLGAYPSMHRPRVIWTAIEAPPALANFQTGIENSLERLGYTREERPFSPHLTLGRISRSATVGDIRSIADYLALSRVGFIGLVQAQEVCLFRSELKPGGAVYTQLFKAALQAA